MYQHDIGLLQRSVRSPRSHSYTDVRCGQAWGVVHAVTTKANTSLATRSVSGYASAQQDILIGQWVSGPLDGGLSITASTGSLVILTSETSNSNNLFVGWTVKVVSNNGTAVQDIIAKRNDGTEVVLTTLTSRLDTVTCSTYTTVRGDRLVIEIGLTGDPSGTATHDGSIRIGDPTATGDLGWADGITTDLCPMVQLTDTLTFNTDLYITKAEAAITVTDTPKATKVYNVNKAEPAIGVADSAPTVSIQSATTRLVNVTEAAIGVADSAPNVSVEATVTPAINKEDLGLLLSDDAVAIGVHLRSVGPGGRGRVGLGGHRDDQGGKRQSPVHAAVLSVSEPTERPAHGSG